MSKPSLLIRGMSGLGDCLHQRAVVRHWSRTHDVWLETPWPSVYYDLEVHLKRKPTSLRTQGKNAAREHDRFNGMDVPRGAQEIRPSYGAAGVMTSQSKTVLEAMCNVTDTPYDTADYTMRVPDEWFHNFRCSSAHARWKESGKPLLVYRPLVARPEWRGSMARNADPVAYAHIMASIRSEFFVISIADLEVGKEWIVGPQLIADVEFHQGQLSFQDLAALFSSANLVVTSSGFGAILAPAVRTPCLNIVGGYENVGAHQSGERFAPYLAIGPKVGCQCFTSMCNQPCDKSIDLTKAHHDLANFIRHDRVCPHIQDPFARRQRLDQAFRPSDEGQPVGAPARARARVFAPPHPLYGRKTTPPERA